MRAPVVLYLCRENKTTCQVFVLRRVTSMSMYWRLQQLYPQQSTAALACDSFNTTLTYIQAIGGCISPTRRLYVGCLQVMNSIRRGMRIVPKGRIASTENCKYSKYSRSCGEKQRGKHPYCQMGDSSQQQDYLCVASHKQNFSSIKTCIEIQLF